MTPFRNYDMPGKPPVLAWNPIVMLCDGNCEVGQDHCWHLRIAHRQASNPSIPEWMREIRSGKVKIPRAHMKEWTAPRRRKKPAVIATMFMGDIGRLPDVFIRDLIADIAYTPQHTFLLLTKFPDALLRWAFPDNAWVGVSVTDQYTADARLPVAAKLKANNKWISYEPALGRIVQMRGLADFRWVACGPETGPKARHFDVDWLMDTAADCSLYGVPFYDKREPGAEYYCGRERPF